MIGIPPHQEAAARLPLGYGGLFYGVYPAVVTEIYDPDGQHRIRVRLPWASDGDAPEGIEVWARLVAFMAGGQRGSWFIPDKDDEVLVSFEAGDPRHPYILGALWNGNDRPPEQMDDKGKNHLKSITSRKGVKVTLKDEEEKTALTLQTPNGQSLSLDDEKPGSITLKDQHGNQIIMNDKGIIIQDKFQNQIVMAEAGVTIKTPKAGQIQTGTSMAIDAGSTMGLEAKTGLEVKSGADIGVKATKKLALQAPQCSITGDAKLDLETANGSINAKAKLGITAPNCSLTAPSFSVTSSSCSITAANCSITGAQFSVTSAAKVNFMAPLFGVTAAKVDMITLMMMMTPATVLTCGTLIATSVASPTYTPGGGNML